MIRLYSKKFGLVALTLTISLVVLFTPAPRSDAADHGDAPLPAHDQACDLADTYLFLDPRDNTRIILGGTTRGFIVPSENVNLGVFDPNVRYRFEFENTGDARPDMFMDVRFSPKTNSSTEVQMATITFSNGVTFTAPTTLPTTDPNPPEPVVTTGPNGILFHAGVVDDPFVFDITGFSRYTTALRDPNRTIEDARSQLQRGRNSFHGYNMLGMVFSFPRDFLRGAGANEIGVNFVVQRRQSQTYTRQGTVTGVGEWVNVDRMATAGVNTALTPFAMKNDFNASTPVEDAANKFTPVMINEMRRLRMDDTSIGVVLNIIIFRGDYVRLNLTVANATLGVTNPADPRDDGAGFPNGRRFGDDVIDVELFLFNNRQPLSDNANRNELPFRTQFPYIAPPNQPLPAGANDVTEN